MPKTLLFKAEDLKKYIVSFFTHLDVPEVDAAICADVLVAADMRGVDSHGIIRLNTYYGNRLRRGVINPTLTLTTLQETPATLTLDAGNGLGMVAGKHAMQRCIEKARQAGIAVVTVRNSNHYSIAGYYAMMALEHDMIGISLTNSQPLVAPTFGRKAMLGTNPIAVAIPAGEERPYVLDMATSIVPIGRITVYQKAGREIPPGWGIDQQGEVTTQPSAVTGGGALLPLGGIELMSGYKGYGLSLLVDILSGVLAGSAFASGVARPDAGSSARVGHFFAALRIDAFRPLEEFKLDMDSLIREMKSSPKIEGQERIYIHGEKEFERTERSLRDGVPVLVPVVEGLKQSGAEIGVPFDLIPMGEGEKELKG
jgi:L-2-hydroxycarboxylate dehydrogenase (NAD+)